MSEAVDRLRAEIEEKAPELSYDGHLRSERTWREHMNSIRRHILDENPAQFLTWHPIISTMAGIGHNDWHSAFRCHLEELPDWENRWKSAIKEVSVGAPLRYFGESPKSSSALLAAAVCLTWFERDTKASVEDLSFIFEFGGGYGCLRRLLDVLGFRGEYVDFDFPVMTALKRFYLTEVGIYEMGEPNPNLLLSDWNQLELALENVSGNSLFLSNWALSETPLALRARVMQLVRGFDYFLLTYQPQFQEVDNRRFFTEFQNDFRSVHWQSHTISGPDSTVLVGTRW